MSPGLSLGGVCAVFAAGLAAERYAGVATARRSPSATSRTLVGVVALGRVWMAHALETIPPVAVGGSVVASPAVAFALPVALYVGLPLVAAPVGGGDGAESSGHC